MIIKIGNIELDLTYYNQDMNYSDGEIEDEILDIVKNYDDYTGIIANDNRWPILYHLSKDRENIVDGFNFNKTDHILEIGAGCGAITGCLSDKAEHVDCVELSKKRSLINAYRNKNKSNISIYVGNFNDIELDKRYDIITLIGVLEYAESFIKTNNPYIDFMKKINKLLKNDGKLYIAIENKYGLKYFAGCKEDHTGKMFEGIEGYANSKGVKTFSYNEINELLRYSGFNNNKFYFPFPDYKLPVQIFSEFYLPRMGQLSNIIYTYDQERYILFNEEAAFDNIIKSGDLKIFSNSFLIECKKE